ncbi:MAG: M42 family metallopeptidase [Defluviitaleaceae bacterium]|nr:M42 family metallopeptidase [Defluviitaleaceae bacterium]
MLLEKLTSACGLPGFEDEVRDIIKAELEGIVDSIKVDRIGNLIVTKNSQASGTHIALSAHMDEVGLCVKSINADGTIKFVSWGVDQRLLPSMRLLVGEKKIPGVIGTKPIHLQSEADRGSVYDINSMFIDIGCNKKEETEKHVSLGDFIAFESKFTEFGESKIKAKALDDRVGCAAIIEILKMDLPYKMTGIFCVQEEVGLRGSAVAAKGLHADLVINFEGTICADTEGVPVHEHVTTSGAGPCLSLMDRSSIYNKKYIESIVAVAEKNKIPYQYRRTAMGGTDAGSYHTAGAGIPCIGIAVPCRYIHSPVSVMDKNDYENLVKLVAQYLKSEALTK